MDAFRAGFIVALFVFLVLLLWDNVLQPALKNSFGGGGS